MNIFTSLVAANASATAGTATPRAANTEVSGVTWGYSTTGGPATVSVKLQGSFDQSTWIDLDSSTTTTGNIKGVPHAAATPICPYFRLYLTTLSGGTAPTLTGWIYQP